MALMKQKLHDLKQCNFQFERFEKRAKSVCSNAFFKNLKSVQKVGKKLLQLFESWQEETRTDTLETAWVWLGCT
jgi:hypothetical protein